MRQKGKRELLIRKFLYSITRFFFSPIHCILQLLFKETSVCYRELHLANVQLNVLSIRFFSTDSSGTGLLSLAGKRHLIPKPQWALRNPRDVLEIPSKTVAMVPLVKRGHRRASKFYFYLPLSFKRSETPRSSVLILKNDKPFFRRSGAFYFTLYCTYFL